MPKSATQKHTETEACAQAIIDRLGPAAAPLELGKPHGLLKAVQAKVSADP